MSYKIGVRTLGDPDFVFNELYFASEQEANLYRIDLFSRWTALIDTKIVESLEPVNVQWENGVLKFIGHEDIPLKPEDEGRVVDDVYVPNEDDIRWAKQMLTLVADKGILAFPATKLIYEVDHEAKTLTLLNPEIFGKPGIAGEASLLVHRRTIVTFREVGYSVVEKSQ